MIQYKYVIMTLAHTHKHIKRTARKIDFNVQINFHHVSPNWLITMCIAEKPTQKAKYVCLPLYFNEWVWVCVAKPYHLIPHRRRRRHFYSNSLIIDE